MHAYYAPQMLVFVLVLFSAFTENSIFADDVSSDTNNTPATQTGTVIDPRSKTSPANVSTVPDASVKPIITEHTVTIDGTKLIYKAEAGMLPLLKDDGSPKASVFFVAYTKRDVLDSAARPILFCFNGGPGARQSGSILEGLDLVEQKSILMPLFHHRRLNSSTINIHLSCRLTLSSLIQLPPDTADRQKMKKWNSFLASILTSRRSLTLFDSTQRGTSDGDPRSISAEKATAYFVQPDLPKNYKTSTACF